MSKETKILVQGITGKESGFWTAKMLESGTNIVAGVTPGKRMGHAGAIISRGKGTVKGKSDVLQKAGVPVAATPGEISAMLKQALS